MSEMLKYKETIAHFGEKEEQGDRVMVWASLERDVNRVPDFFFLSGTKMLTS